MPMHFLSHLSLDARRRIVLTVYAETGDSVKKTAKLLKCPQARVRRLLQISASPRESSVGSYTVQEIIEMRYKYPSVSAMSRSTGIPAHAIRKTLLANGVKLPGRRDYQPTREYIQNLRDTMAAHRIKAATVAKHLGVARQAVSDVLSITRPVNVTMRKIRRIEQAVQQIIEGRLADTLFAETINADR